MGFVEIEQAGKKVLEQFPVIKRSVKRVYQLVSVATSNEKFKCEGDVVRVSPDDGFEYFYGYYDKSPWDISDRYMICVKVKQAYKSVAPKEPGVVGVIDTQNGNKFHKIGVSHSWNVQQSCMAQWMGPDFKSHILYNDFRSGRYCSVIYNFETKKEEKVLPMAAYDVARDGSFILSLDFSRLHRMRPGYGYSNLPDTTKGELCPDKTCIWKVDVATGTVTELFKYTDFAAFEPDETMEGAEHKVNHLMISPNCKRFMVLHRWFQKGRKHTRLVTVNIDKTEMYNLSDDVFVSHCYWKNDEEILSFLRKKETGDHYYLMKDKTQEYKMYWPELRTDGHCSYSPDKQLIITDTYPNRKRIASVYLCSELGGKSGSVKRLARVASPFKYDNDCRCDLHPRWNREGTKICIDSVHEGKRGLYVISVPESAFVVDDSPAIEPGNGKYKIVYFVTRLRKSGPVSQTLDLIRKLDRNIYKPIVVALYKENVDDSMLNQYYHAGAEYYCMNMGRIKSIVGGGKNVANFFDKIKPDLIHSVGMPLYKLAMNYHGCPNFTTIHNYVYEDYPVKYGKALGNAMAMQDIGIIKKNAGHMVTCSKSLSVMYHEKNGVNIDYIRNGVDTSRYQMASDYQKAEMRDKLGLPADKIIAIFTGQVCSRKNQAFAVEGITRSEHDNICLVLLGDGPDLAGLKEKYSSSDKIIFRGQVSNVAEYLQSADFYLSSSTSEGLPVGALEAMSAGLPLLLSDIMQHKEVVEAGEYLGYVFKNNDIQSFNRALNDMLNGNLKQMGAACHEVASSILSADYMTERYEEKYENLIMVVSK